MLQENICRLLVFRLNIGYMKKTGREGQREGMGTCREMASWSVHPS
jgi:hypothetical protein